MKEEDHSLLIDGFPPAGHSTAVNRPIPNFVRY